MDKKLDKMDDEISKLQNHLAQCRMEDQKKDHDILIKERNRITNNTDNIKELKHENKEEHKTMNDNQKVLFEKVEQITGNLNQSMVMLTDLKRSAKIKIGLQTAVVAGVLSTIIAAIIIYASSFVYENIQNKLSDSDNTQILLNISSQIDNNSRQLQQLKTRTDIILYEESNK